MNMFIAHGSLENRNRRRSQHLYINAPLVSDHGTKCSYMNREASHQHENDNDNEHFIILWVRASVFGRFAGVNEDRHFRTFQTNIILLIFFDLWTSPLENAIQFDY
jgi:hypothetical protein